MYTRFVKNVACLVEYQGIGIESEDSVQSRGKYVRNGRRRIIRPSNDPPVLTGVLSSNNRKLMEEQGSKRTPENQIIQDFRKKEGNFFTKTFYQFLSCCADR